LGNVAGTISQRAWKVVFCFFFRPATSVDVEAEEGGLGWASAQPEAMMALLKMVSPLKQKSSSREVMVDRWCGGRRRGRFSRSGRLAMWKVLVA